MNRLIYIILFLVPFMMVIVVNELVRAKGLNSGSIVNNIQTINPKTILANHCSWACYYDTKHCKDSHVKLLQPYFKHTDKAYFGVINALFSTGTYKWSNLLLFAVLIPISLYVLLIKSLGIQRKINALKGKK